MQDTEQMQPGVPLESRAAATLLQTPFEITLAERVFKVAPPTVATLMLLSAEVATLPKLETPAGEEEQGGEKMLQQVIADAEGCGAAGRAVAVMLLGARGYAGRPWWRRESDGKRLARWLLNNVSPRELFNAFAQLIQHMQVADFFAFTAFLREANMLRGRAEQTTTARGHSSRGQ